MIILIIIIILFIAWLLTDLYKQERQEFILDSVVYPDGTTVYFSLNHTNMTTVTFKDVNAMGKKVIATFTLPVNEAGNRPTLVPGSLQAVSSNPEVATAELGTIDEENGLYPLVINYTGKKGSADCKLIASGDLDGSGDAPIEGLVTSVITTDEATGFGEPAVSELQ